jgi:CheY-like chemotaxis protein
MDISPGGKKVFKILVAEDNILNQKLIYTFLHKNNFSVVTAANGEEACNAYQIEKPDLILMDVEMPVVNGYDAVLRIRENEKNNGLHIPILALTGHNLQEDIDKIFECGMDDYIAKPINFKSFIEKLNYFFSKDK